jgi:hypothetical protein
MIISILCSVRVDCHFYKWLPLGPDVSQINLMDTLTFHFRHPGLCSVTLMSPDLLRGLTGLEWMYSLDAESCQKPDEGDCVVSETLVSLDHLMWLSA